MPDIRSILCHVDASTASTERLALARSVGAASGATVTALYASATNFVSLPMSISETSAEGQLALQLDADRRAQALALFRKEAAMPGCPVQWEQLDALGSPADAVARRAMCGDLIVLGQHDPRSGVGLPGDFVESVIVDSGKPALVVPHSRDGGRVGRRVLIAWKHSPECARAVQAALPFLVRAEAVDIALWEEATAADVQQREHLRGHLAAHGINATLHAFGPAPRDVGDAVLSRAADLQSDLLVMGCYGHSRAREWVLGGASRTVLRTMTLPVLMCH